MFEAIREYEICGLYGGGYGPHTTLNKTKYSTGHRTRETLGEELAKLGD